MTTPHEKLWKDTSEKLATVLNPELFARWFAPIRALGLENGALVLGVANEFYQIWLQDNFSSVIRNALNGVSKHPLQVKFSVIQGGAAPTVASGRSAIARQPSRLLGDLKLNPRYTFESFVVGPNNNHAHAAAMAVAEQPGRAYNPLFLYGGVGLGKTHLMQAVGLQAACGSKRLGVCYTTCEQFTNDFIQALQTASLTRFRKRYRQADVLLIDDIHFLTGKERIQEEFFHTFNSLFDGHKQIVLSSDRPAAEIPELESRLVSRFEWGLVTELDAPALETRLAILKKKAMSLEVQVTEQALQFIAERIRTNVRRLEGALVRVASHVSLTGQEPTLESLELLLRDTLHEEARHSVTMDIIQKKVAGHFDLRIADMTSRRRPQNVAFPRQVAMYLCRTLTDRSLNEIGEAFGGRDHGTVLHACRLVGERASKDLRLRQTLSYLEQSLHREQHVSNR